MIQRWAFILVVWGLIAAWASRDWGVGFAIVAWLTFVLAETFNTVVHEAGHALAARAAGFHLLSVQIGRGPALWVHRRKALRLSVHRYAMLGGSTRFILPEGASRWRISGVYAAGAAANLAVAGVLIALGAGLDRVRGEASWVGGAIVAGLLVSNLRIVLNTLWPSTGSDGRRSDGARILAPFRRPVANTAVDPRLPLLTATLRLQSAGRYAEAADLFADKLREWPNDPYLLGMVIHCTSRASGEHAALARYRALVAEAPAGPPRPFDWHGAMVGWLAANIAWSTIKLGPAADLEAADLALQVALERLPDSSEVKATLGALNVMRGELDPGERLLIEAMRAVNDATDRADFCRYVAQARRNRGDEVGAVEADHLRDHILARALEPID